MGKVMLEQEEYLKWDRVIDFLVSFHKNHSLHRKEVVSVADTLARVSEAFRAAIDRRSDLLPWARVEVKATGCVGVIIAHTPEDEEFTYKIRFKDGAEDWFGKNAVKLLRCRVRGE